MHDPHPDARSPVGNGRHGSLFLEEGDGTLDFADLVGAMDAVVDEGDDDELQLPLQLPVSPRGNGDPDVESSSFVVALFCDGFVCRHWTHKSGWVEGFAQSYDATSRYFLDCLEKERLPDGLLELIDPTTPSNSLRAEIWDLRTHPTALCPLTAADLPRAAPLPTEISGVSVRHVLLKPRDQVVLTEMAKFVEHDLHPASEQFPQLSNADLEALTYDELASLALGPDADLVQVDESLALLSVDEVQEADCANDLCAPMEAEIIDPGGLPALARGYPTPQIAVNDDDEHRDSDDVFTLDELISPTRKSGSGDLPSWEASLTMPSSSLSLPTALLSPNDSKVLKPHAHRRTGGSRRSTDEIFFLSWPIDDPPSSDDDWVVQNAVLQSITANESDPAFVKSKNPPSPCERRRPTKQAKKRIDAKATLVTADKENHSLSAMPSSASSLQVLPLSEDAIGWAESVDRKNSSKKIHKKKKKYRCVKPSMDREKPLPATHLFLSRLKGKRPRNYTIDELDEGSPAWMMMKHMTRFYQAAFMFERRHAHFLQVNVERIMTADTTAIEPTKIAAGSMDYLAMQLHDWTRPDEVIAAAATGDADHAIPSPVAAQTTRYRPSIVMKTEDDEDHVSSAGIAADQRSPTSALALIRITSPPLEEALSPLMAIPDSPYLPSVPSPLTPLGLSPTTNSSFMGAVVEGELFEF